ncbi:hypothetical protein GF378_00670 [Candidatus Pacearchaeota archaeon]|nr:hypothetical protein [Candidatus Pacearchaeota archaeon]
MIKEVNKFIETYWKKHIDSKFVYRAMPVVFLKDVRKNGLNPRKNPFSKHKKDINKAIKILEKLHKNGFKAPRKIAPGKIFDVPKILKVIERDLKNKRIDFTSNLSNAKFYAKIKGGAIVASVKHLTSSIIKNKNFLEKLSKSEQKTILKLNSWSKKMSDQKSLIIRAKLSSPAFKDSIFQFKGSQDKESALPVGPLKYFKSNLKKRIKKQDKNITIKDIKKYLKKYKPFIIKDKQFFLQMKRKLNPKEITVIKE